ncbi:hypothetical protein BU25DRAFT_461123 [Macroventuria anomochaeta]|uniref:Uncharacterized protein n=1 Tax=Macroventuria anomochaeta TaxID=301207 RepID=A0ACB6RSC8_9PLEO|nr:uncharacterized protein BU25DRAFT_461123 [Macroventuria anomochaeta]KAF2624602.1 hypothetical protein BU25DRAFT_461123 [Macroventuria anomochaeta]
MTGFSKGKQPTKTFRPSQLRNMQQVPDSDAVVPEMQLEAPHSPYGPEFEDELDDETLATIERLAFKSSASVKASSQPSLALPQTFGIAKPGSAPCEVPFSFGFAKRTTNKTPKEDAPALRPSIHPDTVIPSIEPADNGAPKQDVSTTSAASPNLPSPTIEERVAVGTSEKDETAHGHDQSQESSHRNGAFVDGPDTEPVKPALSEEITDIQTTPQPAARSAPTAKKKHNGTKAKKGKKTLLSRPLVPWPPRHDPLPDDSSTLSTAGSSTSHATSEHQAEASWPIRDVEDLAVKPQPGGVCVPIDGLRDIEESSIAAETALPDGTTDKTFASYQHQVVDLGHVEQPEATQHHVHFNAAIQEPIHIADSPTMPDDPSSYASCEGHGRFSQMQQASKADRDTLGGSNLMPRSTTPFPNKDPKPRPILRPASSHRAQSSDQQTSSSTLKTNLDPVCGPSPRVGDVQEVLHGASSRSGPIRVTKAPKKVRPMHIAHSRASAAIGNSQALSGMTTLDMALDTLRTACLADQYRIEDQMTSTMNDLKEEKKQLQSTISEQLTTITGLQVKLNMADDRLAQLTENVKSKQKYVAGLQKDHEKLQKSAVASQEHTRKTLQDQIDEVVKEKAILQGELEMMIDSLSKGQKGMLKTMKETHMHYVMALSREKDLKDRLDERARMYEEEKSRRVEFEKQLLPALQGVQRQLSENSTALVDKLSSLQTSLGLRKTEDSNDCSIKDCLQILQKLESLPLLTANDVRKAEDMLRFLHERTDAGFELLAKTSESKLFPIEDVQQCMRDQIQGLQTEILRHDQAIADGQLAYETNQWLRTELDTQKQDHQRLEEQASLLRQSEVALKTRVTQLENERDELQATVRGHETQPREAELKVMQLQDQLSRTENDLLLANDTAKQQERLRLEQEREFCNYRVDAVVHLTGRRKQIQEMTDQGQAKDRECNALQQDAANLKIKLESAQSHNDQLAIEVSQYKSTIETLRQETNKATEKEGAARALLQSAEEIKLQLEAENEQLSATIEQVRISLRESKSSETRLIAQRFDLRRQLGELQDAKSASDEQLQQAQHDMAARLQRAEIDHTTELENLQSRLNLSENARKESQAKLRQTEAAHKHQIECHEQKFNARFEDLASQSQQEQEKLKAQHSQEMQICAQEVNTMIAEMELETEKRQKEAGTLTSKTLVPNTQQSIEHGGPSTSSQQLRTGKIRKADGQINSVVEVVPSSNRRLNTDESESVTDRLSSTHNRREGPENQAGYFEEEYQNRFGPQAPLHDQRTQLSLVDPNAEVVPETQEFEYAQGVAAQFEMIESQVSVGDNLDQEETLTDLSTMPSEDLSEMLLDIRPTPGRDRVTLRHSSSPKDTIQTPGRPVHESTSDTSSTHSQGRPKSRANTASRMMPLPAQDMQRQSIQAHGSSQHLVHAQADRSLRADNDSPDFMHANNAASKRTYAQRASVQDVTRTSDTPPPPPPPPQKRKSASGVEDGPFKKLRTPAQSFAQRPASISKSYAPYTPARTGAVTYADVNPSPSSATGRRSSNRQSSMAGSQTGTPRLSSTRNTRSKTNRYADRFGQELDRR